MSPRPSSAKRIWLACDHWNDMVNQATSHARAGTDGRETGGVLLGWRNDRDIVVEHVIGAGPEADHQRSSFRPDPGWQEARIAELYERSGRLLEYLGDWHTHPGGTPHPSRRDERTLRHIASSSEARCPEPVMVIMGNRGNDVGPVGIATWRARALTLTNPPWWRRWEAHTQPIQMHVTT